MNNFFYITFFLISYLPICIAQSANEPYAAQIDLTWKDGDAIVEGRFFNSTKQAEQLTYQLKLQRKSKNGNNVSNQQSGSFNITANGEKLLAITTFSITELDLYRIYLKVYKKGKLIAEDAIVNWTEASVTLQKRDQVGKADPNNPDLNDGEIDPKRPKINPKQPQNTDPQALSREARVKARIEEAKQKAADAMATARAKREQILNNNTPSLPSPSTVNPPAQNTPTPPTKETPTLTPQSPSPNRLPDLEIDGLIIDETRTKVGRDYYEIFYNQWEAPAAAKNYTIRIKELPSQGRGAQIQVLVNDELLIQRFMQPRQDIIEELANRSVSALANWLVQNAKQEKNIADEGIY
ncbi:MAG: CsgE family curli-type amyloid fiber assembly protein [Saprospiraceae bacterium]